MGGVFLCPTPAKAYERYFEDASTFPRVLPPRPSRVRERFHGDIIVSLSSARSRATRGRSRRWGRETTCTGERKSVPLARGNRRAGIERATVARRTPAPRPPLCVDRVRLPINIRSSSRVNRFESSHRGSRSSRPTRRAFGFEFLLIAIAARRARARFCRLFFAGFPFVPFVVPSASPSVVFDVPRVVLPPRFLLLVFLLACLDVYESRARSLSRHRDFHSFVWVDEVLGFTSHDWRMYPNNHEL